MGVAWLAFVLRLNSKQKKYREKKNKTFYYNKIIIATFLHLQYIKRNASSVYLHSTISCEFHQQNSMFSVLERRCSFVLSTNFMNKSPCFRYLNEGVVLFWVLKIQKWKNKWWWFYKYKLHSSFSYIELAEND